MPYEDIFTGAVAAERIRRMHEEAGTRTARRHRARPRPEQPPPAPPRRHTHRRT